MIEVVGLQIRAGAFTLQNVNFTVASGSHAVLMGRTGCGKTTILEAIAGLRPVHAGSIKLASRDVTTLPPASRGVGYVPQDLALFPHLSVRRNISFALDVRGAPSSEISARVVETAGWLGIENLLDRTPTGLSGGEAQRVALGRALAADPAVLLLDEPLSALDDATREEMRAVLRAVREKTQVTMLHVTHHRDDARALADTVLELRDGTVVAG
jgi:molybdate/tungstate transport system ATP-binding protein